MSMKLLFMQSRNSSTIDWSFLGGTVPVGVLFSRACTATAFSSDGKLTSYTNDRPRFDFDPVSHTPLGLLMEEQRTNFLSASQEFSNYPWVKSVTLLTPNVITSPEGALTGSKLIEGTTMAWHQLYWSTAISVEATKSFVSSVFVKAGERTRVGLYLPTALGSGWAIFDLVAGTIASTSAGYTGASIKDVGNGWYRISCSGVASSTGSYAQVFNLRLILSGTTLSYAGDGVSGVYVFGAQVEQGAFPSSYIYTNGSVVTRALDQLQCTIPNGVSTLRYTFDDDSTQDVAVTVGTFNVIADSTHPHIKRIISV